jgi:hypothetical protein
MAAWLASRAVLSAPVAVRRARVLTALESLALDIQMAASAETIDGLKLAAGAPAVRVAGREVSLDWVGGERRISLLSPQSRRSSASFLLFLSFFTGGGAVSGDCIGVISCGVETTGGTVIEGAAGVPCVACTGAPGATVAAPPRPRRRR